jgi:hypothetical protein
MRCSPLTVIAAAAAVAGLTAGCAPTPTSTKDSAGNFRGEQRLVANAVEDLQAAASKSDEGKICRDLLARSLADRLAARGNGCSAAVDAAIKDTDTFDLKVQSVQVTGTRATARVKMATGTRDRSATVTLVRERGAWRIAGL